MSAPTGATNEQMDAAVKIAHDVADGFEWDDCRSSDIDDWCIDTAERFLAALIPPGYRIVGPGVELYRKCFECGGEGTRFLAAGCPVCHNERYLPLEGAADER
jgi:hypothetical protein